MTCTKETVRKHGFNKWIDGGDDGAEPRVDVILVQGLNAHPYYTWVGHQNPMPAVVLRGGILNNIFQREIPDTIEESAADEIFWPKDLLPRHLPPARIVTYSYLSDWRSSDFKTDLRRCGEQLLNVLHQYRDQDRTQSRPIVFIGHSLGGIVIQQALVIANHGNVFADIRVSTAGMIFLGVPTQGCDAARLGAWAQRAIGNDQPLLRTLQTASEDLLTLSRDFWTSYGSLPITCFFESSDSKYGPLTMRTVTPQSATLTGKRRMFLETDHSGLNKFWGEQDDNFQLFLPEVRTIVSYAIKYHNKVVDKEIGKILLPFPKDEQFIDRAGIIDRIKELLCGTTIVPRAALVGLGGVGKSQIAIEFAYRLRAESPRTSIFWVNAGNPVHFQASYKAIAAELRLPGFDDPKSDQLNIVYQWLLSEASGQWLIILDNADDLEFARTNHNSIGVSQHEFTMLSFLPQRASGAILITSRDRSAAFALIGRADHLIDIKPMSRTEARSLIDTKTVGQPGNDQEREELASALEYIPLAITQAMAYINIRQRMTIKRYIELLRRDEQKETSLLKEGATGDLRRDPEVYNSVIRTWQISFDRIREQDRVSADLLSHMSMFDKQSIPEFLLRMELTDDELNEALETLLRYAVIHMEVDQSSFSMHRLVQLAIKEWLRTQGKLERQQVAALRTLAKSYPAGEYENWSTCSLLEPHAQAALLNHYTSREARILRIKILQKRSWYYEERGNYVIAENMAEQSMSDATEVLGSEHHDTLDCVTSLASLYRSRGQWEKAEELGTRVMNTKKRLLGSEHIETLLSMGNLATTFSVQGRWKEAEKLDVKVNEVYSRVLGPNHLWTLSSMDNLSASFQDQGRWREAEELEIKVVEGRTRILGPDHPSTLSCNAALSSIYYAQGRWNDAEELDVHTMKTRERLLGPEHPSTLASFTSLASVYYKQGRLKEAGELDTKASEMYKGVLGLEHPTTLSSLNNLATTYRDQGRLKEAEEILIQLIEKRKELKVPEHREVLLSMSNLATTYRLQGRLQQAEELAVGVRERMRKLLGPKHPDTLKLMLELAFTWKTQGRHNEALSLLERCFWLRRKVLDPQHPSINSTLETINEWRSSNPNTKTFRLMAQPWLT